MARVPSSAIHSRSIRASVDRRPAALGQLLLGEQARLDPLGQLDLLLGVEQRHLADLLQVILDRVRGRTRHRDLRGRKIIIVVAEDEDLLVLAAAVRRDLDHARARRAGPFGLGVRLRGRLVGLGPVGGVRSFRPVGSSPARSSATSATSAMSSASSRSSSASAAWMSTSSASRSSRSRSASVSRSASSRSTAVRPPSASERSSEPCSSERQDRRPRSRLNRLILDGPGPLVRRPGALPRCGVSSAHDHGHPFLRWIDATRD